MNFGERMGTKERTMNEEEIGFLTAEGRQKLTQLLFVCVYVCGEEVKWMISCERRREMRKRLLMPVFLSLFGCAAGRCLGSSC